ncbi:MAG: hypothetical protein KC777_26725 [Cyanobacteria bacterium HKST-UBA02]|nr:hypothetical protein [Cyanobacteria bacterium HKST-UBA02]
MDFENVDTAQAGADLAKAAVAGDGMSASRILEEVGSCKWREVVQAANEATAPSVLYDFPAPVLDGSRLITSSTLNGNQESISVFKQNYGSSQAGASLLPLATVTDARCDKK